MDDYDLHDDPSFMFFDDLDIPLDENHPPKDPRAQPDPTTAKELLRPSGPSLARTAGTPLRCGIEEEDDVTLLQSRKRALSDPVVNGVPSHPPKKKTKVNLRRRKSVDGDPDLKDTSNAKTEREPSLIQDSTFESLFVDAKIPESTPSNDEPIVENKGQNEKEGGGITSSQVHLPPLSGVALERELNVQRLRRYGLNASCITEAKNSLITDTMNRVGGGSFGQQTLIGQTTSRSLPPRVTKKSLFEMVTESRLDQPQGPNSMSTRMASVRLNTTWGGGWLEDAVATHHAKFDATDEKQHRRCRVLHADDVLNSLQNELLRGRKSKSIPYTHQAPLNLYPATDADNTRVVLDEETRFIKRLRKNSHRDMEHKYDVNGPSYRLLSDTMENLKRMALEPALNDTEPSLPRCRSVGSENVPEALWSEKYRAQLYDELLTNEKVNRTALEWIFNISKHNQRIERLMSSSSQPGIKGHAPATTSTSNDVPYPVLLLSGPAGVGKTTIGHCIGRKSKHSIREVNASDDRSAKKIKALLEETRRSYRHVGAYAKEPDTLKGSVIILDEIDGAEADAIKEVERFATDAMKGNGIMLPIIAICNEPWIPALRGLRSSAKHLIVHDVDEGKLERRLHQVLHREGFGCSKNSLAQLARTFRQDVRGLLNGVQSSTYYLLSMSGKSMRTEEDKRQRIHLDANHVDMILETCLKDNIYSQERDMIKSMLHSTLSAENSDAFLTQCAMVNQSKNNALNLMFHETLYHDTNIMADQSCCSVSKMNLAVARGFACPPRSNYPSKAQQELTLMSLWSLINLPTNKSSGSTVSSQALAAIPFTLSQTIPQQARTASMVVKQIVKAFVEGGITIKTDLLLKARIRCLLTTASMYSTILPIISELIRNPFGYENYNYGSTTMNSSNSSQPPGSPELYRSYRKYLHELFSTTSAMTNSNSSLDKKAVAYLAQHGPKAVVSMPLGLIKARFRPLHKWTIMAELHGIKFCQNPLPACFSDGLESRGVKDKDLELVTRLDPAIHMIYSVSLKRGTNSGGRLHQASTADRLLSSIKEKNWRVNYMAGMEAEKQSTQTWLMSVLRKCQPNRASKLCTTADQLPFIPLGVLTTYQCFISHAEIPGYSPVNAHTVLPVGAALNSQTDTMKPSDWKVKTLLDNGFYALGMGNRVPNACYLPTFGNEVVELIKQCIAHPSTTRIKESLSYDIRHNTSLDAADESDCDVLEDDVMKGLDRSQDETKMNLYKLIIQNYKKEHDDEVGNRQFHPATESMEALTAVYHVLSSQTVHRYDLPFKKISFETFEGSTKAVSAPATFTDLIPSPK